VVTVGVGCVSSVEVGVFCASSSAEVGVCTMSVLASIYICIGYSSSYVVVMHDCGGEINILQMAPRRWS
jgi:hypothetical protein